MLLEYSERDRKEYTRINTQAHDLSSPFLGCHYSFRTLFRLLLNITIYGIHTPTFFAGHPIELLRNPNGVMARTVKKPQKENG